MLSDSGSRLYHHELELIEDPPKGNLSRFWGFYTAKLDLVQYVFQLDNFYLVNCVLWHIAEWP